MRKLTDGLIYSGWMKGHGGAWTESDELVSIVEPNVSRKNGLFYISVGFHVKRIAKSEYPERFWNCHAYGSAAKIDSYLDDFIIEVRAQKYSAPKHGLSVGCELAKIISTYMSEDAFFNNLLPAVRSNWMILKELKE